MSIELPDPELQIAEPDPKILALTRETLEAEVRGYEAMLDGDAPEVDIHAYLAARSYFFNGDLRLFGPSPLYSQIALGDQFQLDLAWVDGGSFGAEWQLVELEAARHQLFTKSGQPTAVLTHAMHQVSTWHEWVHDNLDYARKLLPHIDYPLGVIYIGRSATLSDADRKALKRLNYERRSQVRVHTLDRIAGTARSVSSLLEGPGRWWIPAKAFSHSELRSRLPKSTFYWLNNPHRPEHQRRLLGMRLEERKGRALRDEE